MAASAADVPCCLCQLLLLLLLRAAARPSAGNP